MSDMDFSDGADNGTGASAGARSRAGVGPSADVGSSGGLLRSGAVEVPLVETPLIVLERIAELETQIAGLQALQLRAVADYLTVRTAADEALGVSGLPGAYRSMVAEIALAKRVSQPTAQALMDDAYVLVTRHPAVMGALAAGRLGLSAARAIAAETCVLDNQDLLAEADRLITDDAIGLLPGQVRGMAERRVMALDPDAAARRARRARRSDGVRFGSTGGDTGVLTCQLPLTAAASCWHALHNHAAALQAAGDSRTMDRLMCDTLTERVTGAVRVDQLKADITLVMTDTALVGLDDTPAHLVGAGPVTAALARLAATSGSATLRRLFTDPADATVSFLDTRRRRIDGPLRRLVRAADQHCRGINCTSPIRDIDHIKPHAHHGPTTFANTQGLSTGCHHTRDHPHTHLARHHPSTRATTWTTPSGLTYTNLPPPALGHGSTSPTQTALRHLICTPPTSPAEQHLLQHLITTKQSRQPPPTISLAHHHQPPQEHDSGT